MARRREVLIALGFGALGAPVRVFAQQSQKVYRVGVVSPGSAPPDRNQQAFAQALHELGYVDGKNLIIDRRWAEGRPERYAALAADLVQQKVDVIVSSNTPAVDAIRKVAGTVPIVFINIGDPVGSRFVASLARPGGNLTGITNATSELSAKRLQLLKETFPGVSRTGVINIDASTGQGQLKEIERAAKVLGMQVMFVELPGREDVEKKLSVLRNWNADSAICLDGALNHLNRRWLAEFVARLRVPAMWTAGDYAEAGGLMSYGPHWESIFRRGAVYVDRILKGAKPADLPVELPTRFELTVNLKTAKALGIALPPALVARADKVIE